MSFNSLLITRAKIIHYGSKSFINEASYLESLMESELLFFRICKSKVEFFIVKLLHIMGAFFRFVMKFDKNQLNKIKKISFLTF